MSTVAQADPRQLERRYAEVARALRDEIIDHYRDRGESLDTPAGRRTLDTNTTLAAQRGELLLRLLARCGGPAELRGLRVADLGCGFGALSLYLATAGADVTGIDPNVERQRVGARVAERLRLAATFRRGWLEDLVLPDAAFDIAVLNNSLCYIVARDERRRALQHTLRILVPGGWLVMRNPARMAPLDPFTGLPFVHQISPHLSARILRRRERPRSTVRLKTAGAASRELRREGFTSVRRQRIDQAWWLPPRYQHHTARRPVSLPTVAAPPKST